MPIEPVTTPDSQQTRPKNPQWTRVRARARPSIPLPHQDFPVRTISTCGVPYGPHRYPHCKEIPDNIFPLPPYSIDDPNLLTHYEDLFPPDYTPFPNPNMTPQQMTNDRLPIPSIPLEPPPPYDSLFATAVPLDSAEAPLNPWEDPYCWNLDAGLDWD